MIKKGLAVLGLIVSLTMVNALAIQAAPSAEAAVVSVENCGAYLFEWRPMEYGSGRYFAILAGGDTIAEKDVILNRGYDYAYTFASASYPKPWGQAPQLVNMEGTWGIPENWHLLPEGSQPFTNNKNLAFKERYIDVVSLPKGVSASELPPEVRKYLINVDGSDAGAYQGTVTSGWIKENEQWKYRKQDGSFVTSSWLAVDGKQYYSGGYNYTRRNLCKWKRRAYELYTWLEAGWRCLAIPDKKWILRYSFMDSGFGW